MKKCLIWAAAAAGSIIFASSLFGQTVSGRITGGSVTRGGTARGVVVLNIPGGLHVNSNRPSDRFLVATSVRLSARGATVGRVSYPRGHNRRFQFSQKLLNVYEGRVAFPFTVSVPAGFRGDILRLNATVRYQACTDEVCYDPTSKSVVITARVR